MTTGPGEATSRDVQLLPGLVSTYFAIHSEVGEKCATLSRQQTAQEKLHIALLRSRVLPLDTVDNSAGLLDRAPGRAGRVPARRSGPPIRHGRALILVATRLIVG